MNLHIVTRIVNPETAILELEGEIDVYTSIQLKQDIAKALDKGVKILALNVAKVEYLDSTGLGVLIGALKRLREKDGNLIVIAPSMRIMRVFEITGLYKIFSIHATEAEAAQQEGVSL